MKKPITLLMIFAAMLALTACNNATGQEFENSVVSEKTLEITLEAAVIPTAPQKDEVASMREVALDGMSEDDIDTLCSVIKTANHAVETEALYNNLFAHLSNPDDLYWNYFDESGEIQIGWAYDGDMPIQEIMAAESLTEDEAYAKYGSEIMTHNEYSAEDFALLLESLRNTVKNDALRCDLQQAIDEVRLAAETHDVAHAENVYHILHDLDYYLLNYRMDTEGQYIQDKSTISRYYGVLSVYAGTQN